MWVNDGFPAFAAEIKRTTAASATEVRRCCRFYNDRTECRQSLVIQLVFQIVVEGILRPHSLLPRLGMLEDIVQV